VRFDVGVAEGRFSTGAKAVGDGGDDVTAAGFGVEEAAAVAEEAGFAVEIDELGGFEVVGADVRNGLGDLLSVGSDVLDGSAAGVAGDAGEAFDAGVSPVDGVEDDIVPIFAGADFEQDFFAAVAFGL
jgi:hypothetical protein